MRISALLSQKGASVATIPAGASVAQAVSELARNGIGALVVSEDGVHIDGIVSERDIVRRLEGARSSLLDQEVGSIMSTTVHTCTLDDDIELLMTVMTERRVRHVPVVHRGLLAGIVSIGDVVKARIGELERHRNELVDYINAR